MTRTFAALLALGLLPACATAQDQPNLASIQTDRQAGESFRERLPEEEIVYFVLPDRFANGDASNDRGGLSGGPLDHGFDPTHKGFFHGGDLKGLTDRLDYIEGLGVTAIWFAPIFQNKPVQGDPGQESAGYHGYWVTDFTRPDAHFGTGEEFRAFVEAAHARGMKVYMDIITNHTADVIRYEEGAATGYAYRSRGDYPYSRKGGSQGAAINPGFAGDRDLSEANFARLTDPAYAYTPVVPEDERNVKAPAWLNDPIYYHNRGDTTFTGESSRFGDFVGLDDLFTEHPRVLQGFIDIYSGWIRDFGIDGFRIDTARHVNPEFWQSFVPAMQQAARDVGVPNFHIFGEVYRDDPNNGYIAQYTRRDGFPAVLDFAFQQAMVEVVAKGRGTYILNEMFDGDVLYEGGEEAALAMPTFLGNHDAGRFATFVREANPQASPEEWLARVRLAHAMMLSLRGSPVVYSGAEQGFIGDGNDQAAREDMFPSQTASYNDNDLLGTDATTAQANYDTAHPLYRLIAEMSALRRAHPALTRGRQETRHYGQEAGIFAVARHDPETRREYLAVFNTSAQPQTANVVTDTTTTRFETLAGTCPTAPSAPGSTRFALPPFGFALCAATAR